MKVLSDKVALITGAGSGIGRATAVALARAGCHVALNDVREDGLRETERLAAAYRRRVLSLAADIATESDATSMCARVLDHFGAVDILVNNAGVAAGGRMQDVPIENWRWVMDVNLWAHVYTVRALLPRMLERGQGHLVHVASGAGLLALGPLLPYCVSKFAVVGLAEALAAQLRAHGVGVTVVCPGPVHTALIESARIAGSPDRVASLHSVASYLVARAVTPEKVADGIVAAIRANRFLLHTHAVIRLLTIVHALWPELAVRINSVVTEYLTGAWGDEAEARGGAMPLVSDAAQPGTRRCHAWPGRAGETVH
ncbi:MAG: SDR family oxidoreductase [Candidatus Schekmanbacteria bacterium]|nr:SDR family oxidoreductase [Candidatus Schekmanbacteria bacterium]